MPKIPKLRWVIAAMLFLATMINYVDRTTLSVVSVEVRTEFGLTEQDYSHVLTMFLVAYAIMYAGSGYIVDRLGTRWGFAVFMFSWSIAQMLHAFSFGKWSLGAFRFLLGMSEPGNWPAAAKAVAEWFPARQRAFGHWHLQCRLFNRVGDRATDGGVDHISVRLANRFRRHRSAGVDLAGVLAAAL